MHTFIEQVQALDSAWDLPPPPDHPDWQLAFEVGTSLQKSNVANSWLWSLNNTYSEASSYEKISFIAKHHKMYASVKNYVSQALFKDLAFDGSYESVILKNHRALWVNVPDDTKEVFCNAFEKTWYSKTDNINEAFSEIIAIVSAADIHAQRQLGRYYPLLMTIAWANVDNAQENKDGRWNKLATQIAVRCGLDSVEPNEIDHEAIGDPKSRAWHLLAHYARYHKRLPVEIEHFVLEHVHTTEPYVAVSAFKEILSRVVEVKGHKTHLLKLSTVFNPSHIPNDNFYDVLKLWIPSCETLWNTAQDLGMFYTEALEQALLALTSTRQEIDIPHDINIADGINIK